MKTDEAVQKLESEHSDAILSKNVAYGQTSLEIGKEHLLAVLDFFKQNGFEVLMDLTAADYLEPEKHSKVFYFLHNPSNFERARISLHVVRNEKIPSVTKLWAGASWYERELFDLFGIYFDGHPDLKRLLMPDDWKGHPLRKDYALTEEVVQFKHGVRPKVPSEIIPHVKKNA